MMKFRLRTLVFWIALIAVGLCFTEVRRDEDQGQMIFYPPKIEWWINASQFLDIQEFPDKTHTGFSISKWEYQQVFFLDMKNGGITIGFSRLYGKLPQGTLEHSFRLKNEKD